MSKVAFQVTLLNFAITTEGLERRSTDEKFTQNDDIENSIFSTIAMIKISSENISAASAKFT